MQKNTVIKELNVQHWQDVQKLQKKIIDNMHDDEKHFILERSAGDFLKALTSEHTHMLGVFDGNNLIAQSIFTMPEKDKERDMAEFAGDVKNDDLVIFKAILVDPQYRGSNLMLKMLEHIEQKAVEKGRKTSIIQIAVDNPASWINAMRHGMSIQKVDEDPEDKAKVLYLQKNMLEKQPEYNKSEQFHMQIGHDIHKEIPALFNRMQLRVEQGFHGVGLEKANGMFKIVWSKQQQANANALPRIQLQRKLGMQSVI